MLNSYLKYWPSIILNLDLPLLNLFPRKIIINGKGNVYLFKWILILPNLPSYRNPVATHINKLLANYGTSTELLKTLLHYATKY